MGRKSNKTASIYKRKDGRWCGSYYDEEYHRHYVYGKTRTEVRNKVKLKMEKDELKEEEKLCSLQDWVFEFLENYKKNEVKVTTYDTYMTMYRKHIENTEIGKKKLEKINAMDLQKLYNDKVKQGYNGKTVRHISVIINGALKLAWKLRMIPENPNSYTTLPKKIKYEARVLTTEDVEKIVREAKDDELYPIVITTVGTGMRKGEVMALKWENIDFEKRTIQVKGNLCRVKNSEPDSNGRIGTHYEILEPKNKKSKRMIPMLDEVFDALVEQKRRQDIEKEKYKEVYTDYDLVFANLSGVPIGQREFMDKYHAFLKKYKIKDVRFHDLRHTFASLLIEADVSMRVVQELLGHSTITTSMDIYAHVSEKKKVQAIERLELGSKQIEKKSI